MPRMLAAGPVPFSPACLGPACPPGADRLPCTHPARRQQRHSSALPVSATVPGRPSGFSAHPRCEERNPFSTSSPCPSWDIQGIERLLLAPGWKAGRRDGLRAPVPRVSRRVHPDRVLFNSVSPPRCCWGQLPLSTHFTEQGECPPGLLAGEGPSLHVPGGSRCPKPPSTLTFPVVLGAGGLEPWPSWAAAVMQQCPVEQATKGQQGQPGLTASLAGPQLPPDPVALILVGLEQGLHERM